MVLDSLSSDPLALSLLGAFFVGGVHWLAHMLFGDEDAFDRAGVGRTGIAVTVAVFLAMFALLSMETMLDGSGVVSSRAIAAGLIVFMGGVLFMNRGRMWFINILAQKEPLLLGLGVTIFFLFNNEIAMLFGVLLFAIGFISRFTDLIDV